MIAALLQAAIVPDRHTIDRAMAELSETTGFTLKHPVAFELITRGQVGSFLQDRIKDAVKPEEIRAEELTLKKFGFVPQDFDLKKTTLELLTEQTAAFYDFHRKKLYITDWASDSLGDEALVHELAHALADQNFPLERFAKKVQDDSEQSLARQAVVEGQASWLMRAVIVKRGVAPQSGEIGPASSDDGKFPVFEKAPLYFQETLMFPYNEGEAFQQAVYQRLGKDGFARVFQHPPVSAQQIMHPDLYFSGVTPVQPTLPVLKGVPRLVEGPLGELDHSVLLRQYIGEAVAKDVSPHLRGSRYRIYETKKERRAILVYRSAWDDAAGARRFFELYQQVLAKKWKLMEVSRRTDSRVDGRGDDGCFRVALRGNEVTSWEGLKEPLPETEY
jgi:hypothetical protein